MKIIKFRFLVILLLFVIPTNTVLAFLYSASTLFGQYDDSFNPVYTNNHIDNVSEPNRRGIDFSTSVAIDTVNHRLFVSDSDNARVLVFQLDSSDLPSTTTVSYVLGQPGFYTETRNATRDGMSFPTGLAYDQSSMILYVADSINNRITTYNVDPLTISNGQSAINVLGQLDFTSSAQATTQSGLNAPRSLSLDSVSGRLYVADQYNNRILIYDVASITDGENAINVLGQLDFTSSSQATTQGGLKNPSSIVKDLTGNRLFVADQLNHRTLVYDIASITNGENAINVLGQADFTSAGQATTRAGMRYPEGLAYNPGTDTLFVSDSGNNRVTTYDVSAITNGENAINVLGQADFVSSVFSVTQNNLSSNFEIALNTSTGKLFVSDTSGYRIGIFDVSTIVDGENMVSEIAQYNDNDTISYTKSGKNNRAFPNSRGFNFPAGSNLDSKNHRLFIDDCSNSRVLVFQLDSTNNMISTEASNVLGQPNFNTRNSVTSISGTRCPFGGPIYDSDNERLFVSDYNSNRVLVYNVNPLTISNGQNAINVLGQADFTDSSSGTTRSKLNGPSSLAHDITNNRLFVSDYNNNRVLVYNVNPATIVDGDNALNVLGQNDFITGSSATTRSGLSNPNSVLYDPESTRLFVADGSNNRIVVFNVNPSTITDGQNAINVLGQGDYITSSSAITQNGLSYPNGLGYDTVTRRLFVSDDSNNRILSFNVSTSSILDGLNAEEVIGQSDFLTNNSNTTRTGLNDPEGNIAVDLINRKFFVADTSNNRILIYLLPKISTNSTLPSVDSGSTYSQSISVSQYEGTVGFNVVEGVLPSGVALESSTGLISGKPTTAGTYNFKIEVSSNSSTGKLVSSKDFSIVVNSVVNSGGSSSGGGSIIVANGPPVKQNPDLNRKDKNPVQSQGLEKETKTKKFSYDELSCPYFTKQLKLGSRDAQVKAVKSFLIYYGYMKDTIIDDYFDLNTEVAVKKFQKNYSNEILLPWGHRTPTGWWYITTRKKANEITDCVTRGKLLLNKIDENLVNIHSNPNNSSVVIGRVNAGLQFNYYDNYNNWYYVDYEGLKSGWLKSEGIEIIDRSLLEE